MSRGILAHSKERPTATTAFERGGTNATSQNQPIMRPPFRTEARAHHANSGGQRMCEVTEAAAAGRSPKGGGRYPNQSCEAGGTGRARKRRGH